ncbi:hypothetical protein DLJ49_03125 [Rhodovulum sp. 12E13]|uniref:hypothetical protein n=1 Tax=Rhodovulum sp. 12E13 TaxID=2203891 RepID=UPI000E194434|nr:hypothetical protein [Rhodovulum sp. 12E13]RDC74982.1 hypothetical protein DLJ49_03125 [Rhodovulum sp. 12E13]
MLAWLSEYSGALQVVLSALTAVVWLAYLQLLLTNLRHQRRPVLLINTGAGRGLRQSCFLSNLGMEPIYVMDVAIRVEAGDRVAVAAITDVEPEHTSDDTDALRATNQGPLESGAIQNLGTFDTLIRRALGRDSGIGIEEVDRFDLVAIFAVAARNKICASRRGFSIDPDHPRLMVPESVRARQVTGWRRRRALNRWLEARRQGRAADGELP